MTTATWIDLLDPEEDALRRALPADVHEVTIARIMRRDLEPRPRIETRGTYVFGVFAYPVSHDGAAVVAFQEVDVVVTTNALFTVRKSPPAGTPPQFEAIRDAALASGASPGMCLYHLVDEIAEQFLDAIQFFDESIDELEDEVTELPSAEVRRRISAARHDILHVRRVLTPTRDAARAVLSNRLELEGGSGAVLFPLQTEMHFADAYDKLLRATDDLDLSRDLLAGVRDFHQAEIANEQNDVVKRLTAIASLLLLPTFIVGLYGQNFRMPELRWEYGYLYSWGLILATTLAQLWYFRRKKWI